MNQVKKFLKENMHRFGTKNLNEAEFQSNLSSNADERAYDLILSAIAQIALDLDPDVVTQAVEDPQITNTEDDPKHYEIITNEIIPKLKSIADDIQSKSARYI